MLAFLRAVSMLARYGARYVSWAWAHRGFVMELINWLGVVQAVEWIIHHI